MHGEVYGHVTAEVAKWADEECAVVIHHIHLICWWCPRFMLIWVDFISRDGNLCTCNKSEKKRMTTKVKMLCSDVPKYTALAV